MEEFKKKPLDLNEQERVLGWERGIKLTMQGHGMEGQSNMESVAIARKTNKVNMQRAQRILDIYRPYAQDYDKNVRQINFWADKGRRTNHPDAWAKYDDYKQRLQIPAGCQEIHTNWTGLGNEFRKMDEYQKVDDRLKRDEQREIEAVGKVMQTIIETTSQEVYRKYAIILDQPEGDRIKRLFAIVRIIKDTLAGAVSVQKVRWRNKVEAIPMANTIQELEKLMDNLQYVKTSVESEEVSYPGSNPFVPQDWKTIFETKISADGEMIIVYAQVLNMEETTTLEEICQKLKTTVIDKYKLKRDQQPTTSIKEELKVLATRMESMEKEERDKDRNRRGRSYDRDRGRESERSTGRYDRGRSGERGRDTERDDRSRGRERERSRDRCGYTERGRRDENRRRDRSRDRNGRYGSDKRYDNQGNSKECYEYKNSGKCTYEKRSGNKCRFYHENSRKDDDSGSESGGSTDGRVLKKKK